MSDLLQVQGINSKGFGTIPKLVMQDRRLTPQAKAIYAYFCSYAGGGQTAFPGREKIIADLDICAEAYYKGLNQLKAIGYIKAEQERTPKGRFKRNVYTLATDISAASPCTVLPHTVRQDTVPCTVSPYTVKPHTNINSPEYKQEYVNSNSPSSPPAQREEQIRLDMTGLLTEQDIQWQLATIREQLDYDALLEANPADSRLIDEIVSIILDVMVSPSATVRIDREDRPRALVRHQLGLLDCEAIELVLGQYKAVTQRITRKRQYLLTALYNARMELDAHYTNLVNHNRNGGT